MKFAENCLILSRHFGLWTLEGGSLTFPPPHPMCMCEWSSCFSNTLFQFSLSFSVSLGPILVSAIITFITRWSGMVSLIIGLLGITQFTAVHLVFYEASLRVNDGITLRDVVFVVLCLSQPSLC